MSEKEGPEKVSYGKAVVKIYPVKASGKVKGGFMLRWKDTLGVWRSTKVSKGGIVEARKRAKARAKAVELASRGTVEVSAEEGRLLEKLKEVSSGRPWEWLDRGVHALREGEGLPEKGLGEGL